jgi:drug/metabolite transporter (DMT)-like permease
MGMGDTSEKPGTALGWPLLVGGVVAASTASVLIRLTQAPPLVVGTWRLLLAGALLAPVAWRPALKGWLVLPSRDRWLLVASGIALAAHFAAWISSLSLTNVASSVILVSSSPIILAGASRWLPGERVRDMTVVAIGLGLAGTALVAYGDLDLTGQAMLGNLLALVGAGAVSVYMLLGQRLRRRLSTIAYVWPCYAIAGLTLGAACLLSGQPMVGYPSRTYGLLLALAIVPQILGHSAFNWAVRHVPPVYVSLAMLGEPVGATLLAWAILGERPALMAVLGGALILAGILAVSPSITRSFRRPRQRSMGIT